MQLKHIKLAGFKSFVDPTKISFPTNLVGVVGPNGCGKSNVIDAVRWVLGELSAKNLRGESMVDVIFNGSENRKASGQCSIELLFDNSSGKIGGEYAAFNEISIKRVMNRDAQSTYFINSTKCRRKDVQDIFLGTGLGPSSYAIIEQGMVSRLVSAKPEELRTHIEEAAGVSKYRERRRETESRIKKTKENLSRVKDIKDEIERLIRRLENQANAAEKYNSLKKEESENQINTAILFSLEAKKNRDQLQKSLDGLNRDLKIKQAESDTKQSQIDEFRTQNESVVDSYETAQKNFYTIGAEIAKHEANLQNISKSEASNLAALERAKESYEKAVEKESTFKDLSPKQQELKLNISIIKALDAVKNTDAIVEKIKPLEDSIESKQSDLDSREEAINSVKEKQKTANLKLDELKASSFSIGGNIARLEGSIFNLEKVESQANRDLVSVKESYKKAKEKESSTDNLSPKEKAIHLIDSISDLLTNLGSSANVINDKVKELKELLMSILKIASDQSKSYTEEFLKRQHEVEALIQKTSEEKVSAKQSLVTLTSQQESLNESLITSSSALATLDAEVRELDGGKLFVANEMRSLEKDVSNLRLDLRTYEINLQNASQVLDKAGINISELDQNKYQGMDLEGLEVSLDDIQKNINDLGSINLASPDEYLDRQNELFETIKNSKDKKLEIQNIMSDLVNKSSNAESILLEIRQKQSRFNESMRELENKKSIAELDLKSISEKVTNVRLDLKTYEINLENANAKIKDAGLKIEDIDYSKYDGMQIKELQDRLADIQAKIIRLGAINLAAPEEIAQESKRKEELDIQYNDLTEALDKLSGAIKTIDTETKTRFQDSFDAINARMKEVFAKLFGGGYAELALTEGDALNAGVIIMARPPGKKNSSISQLSGGEKALTALALVFGIFELNPAPFCILDEVDAPLDDLNTMRFINMVEEMSKTVQFIFITHNKVSMEKSDHLMGVTMQEAGVSRMVSVDVNQALEFAEA
ncbi:AAA family ATPase [Gammaproteobacteria bacterium]|nr:AAA family ATPase [Gammaproteobacteria bacterium]MDA9001027.1 AAA family ATPase [Gammaproteobacteria bacterium]